MTDTSERDELTDRDIETLERIAGDPDVASGRLRREPKRICRNCGGRGWTYSDDAGAAMVDCNECRGSGYA